MNQSNLIRLNMDKLLLYGIVGTSTSKLPTPDYKELFPSDTYIPPPTRKERRKRERELKKKFPLDFTRFIELHRPKEE